MLGRTGNWIASTLQGNSTKGPLLQRLVQGYKSLAAELGYEQKGAVPMTVHDPLAAPPPLPAIFELRLALTASDQKWAGTQHSAAGDSQGPQRRWHQI